MLFSVFSGNLTLIGLSRIHPQIISTSHKELFKYSKPGVLSLGMISKQGQQPVDQETADKIYLQSKRFYSDIQILLYAVNNTYVTMARNSDMQTENKVQQSKDNEKESTEETSNNSQVQIFCEQDETNTTNMETVFHANEAGSTHSETGDSEDTCAYNESLVQYEKKLTYLNKAIEERPTSLLYSRRSTTNLKLERYNEALHDINKAIEIDHNKTSLFSKRATIYILTAQYEKALSDLNVVISTTPSEIIFRKRAALYALIGKNEEALNDLVTAESFNTMKAKN